MSRKNQDIATVLRENGLSVTKQRLFVFELLEGKEPLSMYELYDLAKGQLDRASLYRIISIFEELGVVQRVNIGWKYKLELSDKYTEHHHHLTCLNCQKVIPINEAELEAFITNLAATHNFKPAEHQIEIQGYCLACQKALSN
ncbi:MAG TPA: Fur family transcriptional regulator [Candidatus Saccharimonadales bacterium]|jgi:Fur family zinc uptake transcriptional regulator|nr:Fur family transcriptional regulator [Candidatus Saccharimonadales bacterium]